MLKQQQQQQQQIEGKRRKLAQQARKILIQTIGDWTFVIQKVYLRS